MKKEKNNQLYDDAFARAEKRFYSDNSAQQEKAFTTFKELEKVGYVGCFKYLARCYLDGIGCDKNIDKAREYCVATIALGHYNDRPGPTSYEMIRGIDDENYSAFTDAEDTYHSDEKSPHCLRAMFINYVNTVIYGASKGTSWLRLGDMYYFGIGVEMRKNWAVYLWARAYSCDDLSYEDEAEVLFKIGKCFYYGEGVEKDVILAKAFFNWVYDRYWSYDDSDEARLCEYLLSGIGELDRTIWEDGYEYFYEEDFLDDKFAEWFFFTPDYI